MARKAIIIGAGAAGVTAAVERLRETDVQPVVIEASGEIGGISRTIRYKGNRMDIGGHRFFSKSDRVMQWWVDLMPPEEVGDDAGPDGEVSYQGKTRALPVPPYAPEEPVLRGTGPRVATFLDEETIEEVAGGNVVADVVTHAEVRVSPESPDLVMLIRPRKS